MYWNHLKKTALLGTAKMPLHLELLPEPIQKTLIKTNTKDTEEIFLKASAMTLLYEKAGVRHEKVALPNQAFTETETLAYCSKNIHAIWQGFLNEAKPNEYLVAYLIQLCTQKQWVIRDNLIVPLLNKFFPRFKVKLYPILGKRGLWLTQFNPNWQDTILTDNVWTEGKPSARKLYFSKLRKEKPQEALALLQASWSSETGRDRKDFLMEFFHNLSSHDLDFLENILVELRQIKNPKTIIIETIRIVNRLKLGIYGSDETNQIAQYIAEVLPKYTEPNLITKPVNSAFWEETQLRDIIGIESLSPYKRVSDELYWLSEILTFLHPQYIIDYFGHDMQTLTQKLGATPEGATPEGLLLNVFAQNMKLATPEQIYTFLSHCDYSKCPWLSLVLYLGVEQQEQILMKSDAIDLVSLKEFVLSNPEQEFSVKFSNYVLSILASVIIHPQNHYALSYEHDLMNALGRCLSTKVLKYLDIPHEKLQTEIHKNLWTHYVVSPLKTSLYFKEMIQAEIGNSTTV